jgi:hypothetical protein
MPARRFITAALILGSVSLAACGGTDLSTEDAHDTRNRCRPAGAAGTCLDDSQKRTIAFPNHFKNVATGCDGYGHRIFQTTGGDLRIYADPSCPGWTEQTPQMGVLEGAR